MLKPGRIHYELSERDHGLLYGGMGAIQMLVRRLGLAKAIDQHLHLFKRHNPYFESDHVLNIAYNILCNGECLEDIERLRNDEAYLNAEFEYQPVKCRRSYRIVVLRKNLSIEKGEDVLFDDIRYFFYITNDRKTAKAGIVRDANNRCNQENLIEQLKNGVRALRMPIDVNSKRCCGWNSRNSATFLSCCPAGSSRPVAGWCIACSAGMDIWRCFSGRLKPFAIRCAVESNILASRYGGRDQPETFREKEK